MRMNVEVVSDQPNEYIKNGVVHKQQMIACMDRCQSGARLVNTFDYILSEDEKNKFAGKLLDKRITLDVTELSVPFGSRLRARGKIHEVSANGK